MRSNYYRTVMDRSINPNAGPLAFTRFIVAIAFSIHLRNQKTVVMLKQIERMKLMF